MSEAMMNLANNLAVKVGMGKVGDELISTLKSTAFKGNATDDQFMALMIVANQYGLNPWTREIYAFPDKQNGIVPVVGVDGWSRIINENPQFDGMSFEQNDDSCTCIIYRKDRNHPISATEYLSECLRPAFKSKDGYEIKGPWQSHPKRMLRHKALIQCARLAFGYTGIYDQDEAERIVEKEVVPDKIFYSEDEFNNKLSSWAGVIKEGKKNSESLIVFIESKGKFLTDAQKAVINSIKQEPVKPAVIDAEFTETPSANVDTDFLADMEKAESAGQ
jgi:phage recombination protein Bet